MNLEGEKQLQGSYRLHVANFQGQIKNNQMLLKFDSDLQFHISDLTKDQIVLKLKQTEKGLDVSEQTRTRVKLIEGVNSYNISGSMLFLCDDKKNLIIRARNKNHKNQQQDSICGKWTFDFINLPLEVRENTFEFQGLNHQKYKLKYNITGESISFSPPQNLDNQNVFDSLFVSSLLNSSTFQTGQVSFQLFDNNKKLVAKGTPYM